MKSIAAFVLILVSGASCRDVMMEREFMTNRSIERFLRASTPSDECTISTTRAGGVVAVDELTRRHKLQFTKVTDPDDCKRFYICLGEGRASDNSFACSEYDLSSQCFDPEAGQCSDDSDNCNSVCGTNPKKCQRTCEKEDTPVANPENCSQFFLCRADPTLTGEFFKDVHTCGSEYPYFNGKHCVKNASECCNCQKDVCLKEGDLIADPLDCHSYYTCILFGVDLQPVGPISCEGSGSFINGKCDGPTDCEPRCDSGGGLGTTITTTTTTRATTPTITPPNNSNCNDIHNFHCPGKGYYARCKSCDSSYFYCEGWGHIPTQKSCSNNKMFHPEDHYCVDPIVCE